MGLQQELGLGRKLEGGMVSGGIGERVWMGDRCWVAWGRGWDAVGVKDRVGAKSGVGDGFLDGDG